MEIIRKIRKAFLMDEENAKNDHIISENIFKAYDIRGIAQKTLFNEDMYAIGRAFASFMYEKQVKRVCVGYDCRNSSSEFFLHLMNGLIDSGAHVISLGICHTPMMYYAVKKFSFDAGMMITASHNPSEYNGIKIVFGEDPFCGDLIKNLYERVIKKKFVEANGREIVFNKVFQNYISDLMKGFNFSANLKVAWDIGNGATSPTIKYLTSLLPGQHHLVFEEMDGNFPNRSPDPLAENSLSHLSEIVVNNRFDVGVAFDSDGDRLAVVNNKGILLDSDQVLKVLSQRFLKKNPGAQVIGDVKFSDTLFSTIKKFGGIPIIERAGHSYIKNKMKSTGALLAGEMSGHFFFKDRWFGFDDGVYAALRILEILNDDRNAFSELARSFITPEIRIECDDHLKFEIINSIKQRLQKEGIEFIDLDGVRVNREDGWWILRASNTQNALSLRIEAHSKDAMKRLKENIVSYIVDYIPEAKDLIDKILKNYNNQ